MLKIEKNLPAPASKIARNKYPFGQMEVGDSFLVPLEGKYAFRIQSNMLSAARRYRPKRFATRSETDGVRVWRIS